MKRLLLFLSMFLLVGGTTMAFANGANGSDLMRVSNSENGASTNAVVQLQNNNSGAKPLEATNNKPVITFTTSKEIGEEIKLTHGSIFNNPLSSELEIEGAFLISGNIYVLTAQTVKIIGNCLSLGCSENGITSIDLSNSKLIELSCSSNQLKTLDLSNNRDLRELDCSSNRLRALDLSKNSRLTQLKCNNNLLTALDLPYHILLKKLECYHNQLRALDLSFLHNIEELDCSSNQLRALDLSKNSRLTKLYCVRNKLKSLDLSNNRDLRKLDCSSNQLRQIQLTYYAEKLDDINCVSNKIDLEHMEQLINSLPERTAYRYRYGSYNLYVQSSSTDGNQITEEQAKKSEG